ncbi:MAG TPA: CHAT domain-containing protein [Anaerolineales bacterium]|nr:CHAT domain-containing protein [Anaerolineales bacterium]
MNTSVEMGDPLEIWLVDDIPHQMLLVPLPNQKAGEVIERLRTEFDRYMNIDPNHSLKYTERIIAIGSARNDPSQIALGMMAKSDCLISLGRMEEAWSLYEQAGVMFQTVGDEVGWARTRIGRLYLGPKLNRVPTTLAEAEQARAIFIRHNEHDRLVRLDWQTGIVYNYLGEQHRALEFFAAALAMAESLGAAGQLHIGPLYVTTGLTYYALGDFHQALAFYERARELISAQDEPLLIANVDANIAKIAQAQGHYLTALKLLHGALEKVTSEAPFEAAMTRQHMVECYLALNRYTEARDLARQVIDDCRTFQAAYELGCTLLLLATAEAALGNLGSAQTALAEAEPIFTSLNATTWVATIQLWRGRMALREGNIKSAYQGAVAAESSFQADEQKVNEAAATLLRGEALFALSEMSAAVEAGKRVLRIAQHFNVPSLRHAAHLLLGQIAEAQDATRRAARYYRAASATIERVQRGLTITIRSAFLEDKGEATRALIALLLKKGEVGSAFETLERAKSQMWLGYLINREHLRWARNDAKSLALIKELDGLRAEHQWFYSLAHNQLTDSEIPNAVLPEQARHEVAVRERRMRAITEQLYLHSGGGRWDNQAPVISLGEIQQELKEGTVLIEYYRDGEQFWAFTVDKQTVHAHRLPLTTGDLNQLIRMFRSNLSAALQVGPSSPTARVLNQQGQKILRRMYAMLIEPLMIEKKNPRKLIVVPYGALHALPFQLLYDGSKYLIERYEIVNMPAGGLVTQHGTKRPPGALVLAHSWDGRLPQTHPEAEFVHQLFGGQLLRDDEVKQSVLQRSPTQVLHIAAHGEYRLDQPDLSYIRFADGQLYTDDVLQQDLSYELVTLSACETGLANVAASEELIGLGRGFLHAGAGALIFSLWAVADYSTVDLMRRMYEGLSRGESKAASLRHAQTSIVEENRDLHPAYWGAFQLIGDDRALSVRSD